MTGNVIDRFTVKSTLKPIASNLLNNDTMEIMSTQSSVDPSYAVTIAITLAFMAGLTQVI